MLRAGSRHVHRRAVEVREQAAAQVGAEVAGDGEGRVVVHVRGHVVVG